MTRLDENRAKAQLAKKAGVPVTSVTNLAIWGNHSSTQYPDFFNARIDGRPAPEALPNHEAWLAETFIPTVQQRGAAIIKARGQSSAASAANAVVDTVRSLVTPTAPNDWASVAVASKDNPYGLDEDLICSFPVQTEDGRTWQYVPGLDINEFSRQRIAASVAELSEEKALVADLLPS
jgi:malate dehydrogenase